MTSNLTDIPTKSNPANPARRGGFGRSQYPKEQYAGSGIAVGNVGGGPDRPSSGGASNTSILAGATFAGAVAGIERTARFHHATGVENFLDLGLREKA